MKKQSQVNDLDLLKEFNPVKIIKIYGDLRRAETADGVTVYRSDTLWMGEEYGMVKCCPYDNHFIFHDPNFEKYVGRWTPLCSCGYAAGVVGSNVYKKDGSPTTRLESTVPGQMIVCLAHAQWGRHADGSS